MLGGQLVRVARSELLRGEAFVATAEVHIDEPDVHSLCLTLAEQCVRHTKRLSAVLPAYGPAGSGRVRRSSAGVSPGSEPGPEALLRDLQELHSHADLVHIGWVVILQAAKALGDADLGSVAEECDAETSIQLSWLETRLKHSAPQTLIAAG